MKTKVNKTGTLLGTINPNAPEYISRASREAFAGYRILSNVAHRNDKKYSRKPKHKKDWN